MADLVCSLSVGEVPSLTVAKIKSELQRLRQPLDDLKRKADYVEALTAFIQNQTKQNEESNSLASQKESTSRKGIDPKPDASSRRTNNKPVADELTADEPTSVMEEAVESKAGARSTKAEALPEENESNMDLQPEQASDTAPGKEVITKSAPTVPAAMETDTRLPEDSAQISEASPMDTLDSGVGTSASDLKKEDKAIKTGDMAPSHDGKASRKRSKAEVAERQVEDIPTTKRSRASRGKGRNSAGSRVVEEAVETTDAAPVTSLVAESKGTEVDSSPKGRRKRSKKDSSGGGRKAIVNGEQEVQARVDSNEKDEGTGVEHGGDQEAIVPDLGSNGERGAPDTAIATATVAMSEEGKVIAKATSAAAPAKAATQEKNDDAQMNEASIDPLGAGDAIESVDRADAKAVTIRVENFVRPFTQGQAKKLLEEKAGAPLVSDGFWMDSIKTHCYASFGSKDAADRALASLQGLQWPERSTKRLSAKLANITAQEASVKAVMAFEERRRRSSGGGGSMKVPASAGAAGSNGTRHAIGTTPAASPMPAPIAMGAGTGAGLRAATGLRAVTSPGGSGVGTLAVGGGVPPAAASAGTGTLAAGVVRGRGAPGRAAELVAKEVEEEPPLSLDEIFRKTEETPSLYWLPLSEEEVGERRKKMKETGTGPRTVPMPSSDDGD
ncbi:unnamed protein product, partial [Choristocarpus tenellus]